MPPASLEAAPVTTLAAGEPAVEHWRDLRGRNLWLVSFAVWTFVALLDMAGSRLYAAVAATEAADWRLLLTWSLDYAEPLALLTPIIYLGSRRFVPSHSGWIPTISFHLAGSILFALGGACLAETANMLLPWSRGHVIAPMRGLLAQMFLGNLPRYCVVVAVSQVVFYYSRYHERQVTASQLEAQLAHAQLSALKMQLEPHFIFNVLNAIVTLSRKDPAAAESMTLQLAELLRMSLESVDIHEVPLSRELQFLECYLRIQQTRFSDRLTVAYHIDPSVLNAAVPHLVLQPLVENAIRHGIGPRLAPGRVDINASQLGGRLHLEILDDGVGWPPKSAGPPRAGVGLSNTRARLRQLYGNEFEFECASAPGGGCSARIVLPFRPLSSACGRRA
jgi:signal transduction histidine kinase